MTRLVIKIGSNILASGDEGLDLERIQSIADDLSALQDNGHEIVVVSSGAIAAGTKKLGLKERPGDIILKQAAASVGQSSLMHAYEKSLGRHNKKVGQILLTRDDFSDRKRYINSRNTIIALLSFKVIPIINENDTVATDELKFGDNDHLASLVASAIEADRFIILSDVDGLFTADPRKNPDASLIETVEEITPELEATAGGSGTLVGTGGMYSKVTAAKKAVLSGVTVNIINGRGKHALTSLLKGIRCGTEFRAKKTKPPLRKSWIAHGSRAQGSVCLDDGAVRALTQNGKSLLPSGIVSITGRFDSGDPVYCIDKKGNRIAKGITNYSSSEIEKIKGQKTANIQNILGYTCSDEVIHRDNLVLL